MSEQGSGGPGAGEEEQRPWDSRYRGTHRPGGNNRGPDHEHRVWLDTLRQTPSDAALNQPYGSRSADDFLAGARQGAEQAREDREREARRAVANAPGEVDSGNQVSPDEQASSVPTSSAEFAAAGSMPNMGDGWNAVPEGAPSPHSASTGGSGSEQVAPQPGNPGGRSEVYTAEVLDESDSPEYRTMVLEAPVPVWQWNNLQGAERQEAQDRAMEAIVQADADPRFGELVVKSAMDLRTRMTGQAPEPVTELDDETVCRAAAFVVRNQPDPRLVRQMLEREELPDVRQERSEQARDELLELEPKLEAAQVELNLVRGANRAREQELREDIEDMVRMVVAAQMDYDIDANRESNKTKREASRKQVLKVLYGDRYKALNEFEEEMAERDRGRFEAMNPKNAGSEQAHLEELLDFADDLRARGIVREGFDEQGRLRVTTSGGRYKEIVDNFNEELLEHALDYSAREELAHVPAPDDRTVENASQLGHKLDEILRDPANLPVRARLLRGLLNESKGWVRRNLRGRLGKDGPYTYEIEEVQQGEHDPSIAHYAYRLQQALAEAERGQIFHAVELPARPGNALEPRRVVRDVSEQLMNRLMDAKAASSGYPMGHEVPLERNRAALPVEETGEPMVDEHGRARAQVRDPELLASGLTERLHQIDAVADFAQRRRMMQEFNTYVGRIQNGFADVPVGEEMAHFERQRLASLRDIRERVLAEAAPRYDALLDGINEDLTARQQQEQLRQVLQAATEEGLMFPHEDSPLGFAAVDDDRSRAVIEKAQAIHERVAKKAKEEFKAKELAEAEERKKARQKREADEKKAKEEAAKEKGKKGGDQDNDQSDQNKGKGKAGDNKKDNSANRNQKNDNGGDSDDGSDQNANPSADNLAESSADNQIAPPVDNLATSQQSPETGPDPLNLDFNELVAEAQRQAEARGETFEVPSDKRMPTAIMARLAQLAQSEKQLEALMIAIHERDNAFELVNGKWRWRNDAEKLRFRIYKRRQRELRGLRTSNDRRGAASGGRGRGEGDVNAAPAASNGSATAKDESRSGETGPTAGAGESDQAHEVAPSDEVMEQLDEKYAPRVSEILAMPQEERRRASLGMLIEAGEDGFVALATSEGRILVNPRGQDARSEGFVEAIAESVDKLGLSNDITIEPTTN